MLAIAAAVLFIPSAFAVHTDGVFELDGNAIQGLNSVPAMPNYTSSTEDANNICAAFVNIDSTNPKGNDKCNVISASSPTTLPTATTSTRAAFVTDGSGPFQATQGPNNDDQYTGGSGDAQDVSAWLYKNAPSSNDKSDIQNAFAAFYTHGTDKLVYFGGDRTSNGGDENTAFWFLQNPAVESPNGACTNNNGCPFTTDGKSLAQGGTLATHVAANPGNDHCLANPTNPARNINFQFPGTPCTETDSTPDTYGDILVVSAFTGGGVQPNTTAYEWIGSVPYAYGKGADNSACGTSACTTIKILDSTPGCAPNSGGGDPACAITTQRQQYTSCPTTGNPVPPCVAGQAAIPTQSPWIYSEKSSDNSNTGANMCTTAANKFCPGVYFEGGLNLTALGLQSECTSTFVMNTRSSQSVSASLQDVAVGQVGSCSVSLTSQHGDTTASGGVASPTSIGTGSVNSGTDTATLTVQGANSWAGTLSWYICGGPTFTAPGGTGPQCDRTQGVPAGSTHVAGTDSNAHTYVSGSATLTAAGTYCWTAHFEPDAGQNAQIKATDDTGANECFTVAKVTPALSTCSGSFDSATPPVCTPATAVNLGSQVHDYALLSGLATEPGSGGGGIPGIYTTINPSSTLAYAGSISFELDHAGTVTPPACGAKATGTGTNPQSVNVDTTVGNKVYGPENFTPDAAGSYYWQATISNASSKNNVLPQSDDTSCNESNENVVVNQHPTTTVTGPVDGSGASLTTAIKGVTSVYDHALVTDTDSGGPPPTGSVSFWICNPSQTTLDNSNNPTCAADTGTPVNPDNSVPPKPTPVTLITDTGTSHAHATSTPAVVPDTVGVWCFRATYTPDTTAFTSSSDNSNDECFNVVDVNMTTAQTFTLTDSATITPSGPGATIGGTVDFSLYTTSDCSGSTVFTGSKTVPDQSSAATVSLTTSYSTTSSKPTLSWLVVYTPDATATQKTVTKACHSENASVTIDNG